ncbi:glucose PTS transporter subunit IIA [Spiroplasma taiwanense]|uniref:glucose PTS transporter subunit IIA n=1 Tax=Spiroplasma taiwanense TaxID=2145 RepID=UPI0003F772A7|nr:glucose PTS transporter subunit IIA [Spiroplasma taiwanense]
MEKIKVYASVDGEIDLIENLNDGVFSEKMLGDGFYIKLSSQIFKSPIENGKLSLITDTKHAFFFEIEKEISVLMHIGLDTVSLKGKPFNILSKLNQNVNLDTKIVEVDLELIEKSGLSSICPITINSEKIAYKFNLLTKTKNVKTGDLIGEFEQVDQKELEKPVISMEDFFSSDNTYRKVAKKLIVGSSNYDEVFNCMTILRFKIRDTQKVDVEKIKKVDLVKGIIWNGKQLQVIIGQDVYKVKDEVLLLNQQNVGDIVL